MKKVININFQGRVIPIEESAYEILQRYTTSLSKLFANEEGKEEIINDIEGRIGELFAETLKKGSTCISDDDINTIINSMGRPEDFDVEETATAASSSTETNTDQGFSYLNEPKKLFRDENNKVIGGVCSGLANYFGLDPMVVRILALILLFTVGIGFLAYLIIWVAVPSSATKVIGSRRKRLFRDNDDKIVAGVSSGLAHYFGINVWIPRVLFALPFFSFAFRWSHIGSWDYPDFFRFSFSPGALVVYIILWIILPEATSSADKLEMRGEKVDFNSIKETIQNDMKGFAKRAEKWGEEVGEKGKQLGENINQKAQEWSVSAHDKMKEASDNLNTKGTSYAHQANKIAIKAGSGLGDVILVIFKIFAYFIVGCILFGVVCGLFGIGVMLTGFLPLKDYFIRDGWQNIYAWGTLLLFVWVPIIAVITFIIRRLTKSRANSNAVRWGFAGLWTLGWVFLTLFLSSMFRDFDKKNNAFEENVAIANPSVNKLEVKTVNGTAYYNRGFFDLEPFANVSEDSAFLRNVIIRITKSSNDSFQVKMVRMSRGRTVDQANNLAEKIRLDINQRDSFLLMNKGININTADKFRNQHVILTIAVPVGKKILIHENAAWGKYRHGRVSFGWDNDDWDWENYSTDETSYDYNNDVEYIMTATDGLKRTQPKKKSNNFRNDSEDDNSSTQDKIEDYKRTREEAQRALDEEKKAMEQKQRELEERQKELDKPLDSKDTTPRYKYKPEAPKAPTPAKTQSTTSTISFEEARINRFTI